MAADGTTSGPTIKPLNGVAFTAASFTSGGKFIKIGNLYGQGSAQPVAFDDPGMVRYTNPYMIIKDRYEVNGSQATNIGYVNVGNGDYRWFMYGEQEARKRFEDKREMMMLFGQKERTN